MTTFAYCIKQFVTVYPNIIINVCVMLCAIL